MVAPVQEVNLAGIETELGGEGIDDYADLGALYPEAPMAQGSYKQFCPVAMAAEILCTRWTVLLLRELIAGSTRFNDLRRGVPRRHGCTRHGRLLRSAIGTSHVHS